MKDALIGLGIGFVITWIFIIFPSVMLDKFSNILDKLETIHKLLEERIEK